MKSNTHSSGSRAIEVLEPRIAPATVLPYTDVDGDLVKITISKGNLNGHVTFADAGIGQRLEVLDLTDPSFADASVKFTVKRGPNGDGLANVGYINAAGIDLRSVIVKGDLSQIDVGDGNAGTPALRSLSVYSLGKFGADGGVGGGGGGGGGGEPPLSDSQIQALLNLVLEIGQDGPGLLQIVRDQVLDLQEAGVPNSSVTRLLGLLQADVNALLGVVESLTDGVGGGLGGGLLNGSGGLLSGVAELLENVLQDVNRLSELSPENQELLGFLPPLLTEVGDTVEDLLGLSILNRNNTNDSLLGGLLPGLSLDTLLGLDLDDLPPLLGDTLGDVSDLLSNLLNDPNNLVDTLPATVRDLVLAVEGDLEALLGGSGVLDLDVLRDLAGLQTTLTSLLNITEQIPEFLEDGVQPLLLSLNVLIGDIFGALPGGGGGQDPDAPNALSSDILGDVRRLVVRGDVSDVFVNIQGNLNSARIGGTLSGSDELNSGGLYVSGSLKALRIVGSVVGGDALNSGSIQVDGATGRIVILGSVIGGDGDRTGSITLGGDARLVSIRGDLAGRDGMFSGSVVNTNGGIRQVLVKGSVIGSEADSGAAISVTDDIRTLRIRGGLLGDADNIVTVSAGGELTQDGKKNFAFRQVRIGGAVDHAMILGGYDADLDAINGSAQIGNIVIGGDFHASSIAAGVEDVAGDGFGDEDDRVIEDRNSAIVSRIASVLIRGTIIGTAESVDATDQHGVVAAEIGRFVAGRGKLALTPGSSGDTVELSQGTGDVTVREVPQTPPAV